MFLPVPQCSLVLFEITDLAAFANPEMAGVGGSTPARGTMLLNNLSVRISRTVKVKVSLQKY